MYKTHRVNHDFQIAYFLAGKCHTPDGAYALLQDLRDDRAAAIDSYAVTQMRNKAKRIRLADMTVIGAAKLEHDADILEMDNNDRTGKVLYDAAVDELKFIDKLIDALQPMRKFKDLPDPEAHEAAQREEWLLELIERAENMIFCQGTIAPDHFAIMRAHPDFETHIMPTITKIRIALETKSEYNIKAPAFLDSVQKTLALPKPE